MNGFTPRSCLTKLLGLNGHFTAYPIEAPASPTTRRRRPKIETRRRRGRRHRRIVEGQALASGWAAEADRRLGARHGRRQRSRSCRCCTMAPIAGRLGSVGREQGRRHRLGGWPTEARASISATRITIVNLGGLNTPFGRRAADPRPIPVQRDLRSRHGRVRQLLSLHAARQTRSPTSSM